MKVGDLVMFPSTMHGANPLGVVLQTKPDGINRGTPRLRRVRIHWIQDNEASWEPAKWLEVISEK